MDLKKVMEDKIAAFAEAYKRGDATGCAAIYAEDAFQLAPNQPMMRGRQADQGILPRGYQPSRRNP